MVYITLDGRFVHNNIFSDEGDLVLVGTTRLIDGTLLITPKDHTIPDYVFTSDLHSKAVVGSNISYNIVLTCSNNVDPGKPLSVDVPIPTGFSLVNAISNEGTYNVTTGKWNLVMDNQSAILNLILSVNTAGSNSQTVSLDGNTATLTKTCVISATDTGTIASCGVDLNDFPNTISNLQEGLLYTIVLYSRVHETGVTGIYDGVKNNRITITNGSTYYGTRAISQDTITKIYVTFIYDENQPLVFTHYEEYQSVSTNTSNRIYGFCVKEGLDLDYDTNKSLFTDPLALFDDTGSTNLVLEGNTESAIYQYEFAASSTTASQFFSGLMASLNTFGTATSGLQIQIETEDGDISLTKSLPLTSTGQVQFGELGDMWSLTDEKIQNKKLYITLSFINSTTIQQTFSYGNLQLTMYYADDTTGGDHTIIAKEIHGKIYGIALDKDKHDEGPIYNLETKTLPLTDGELPIRFNITKKTLEADFVIHGDTLEESQTILKSIRRWLRNERNVMNRPVTYPLQFTYDLSRVYNVLFVDAIETEKRITSIACTIRFTVPEGVGRSINPVISGPVGQNQGECEAWPIIEVKTTGNSTLIITDTITGNQMTLTDAPAENTILYFNCATQTVEDSAGTDYTLNMAKNTVWISFMSTYQISVTGGIFQQLSYYPGD